MLVSVEKVDEIIHLLFLVLVTCLHLRIMSDKSSKLKNKKE